jgi:ABC-2 type transport system ATP-binding protein
VNDIIQAKSLTKIFPAEKDHPSLCAVGGVDLAVHPGEVFGFLGPNGAGKTTTIRMLTGLTRPTSGTASILGFDLLKDVTRIKKHIGVIPEASNLYDELTAFDNLVFSMQLYGVPRREWKARAEELLSRFRLSEKRDTPFAKLSRGMKRALTIAAGLAHRPPLVFLDEPTTGLDVMSARSLRQMIAGLREQGVTVFLTTHYLEEAERLCDRVAVIVMGCVVALDTVEGLRSGTQQKTVIEVTLANPEGQQVKKRIECDNGVEAAIQRALADTNGWCVLAVDTLRPSLEDIFVQLTGLNAEVLLAEKGSKGGGGNAGG